MKRIKLEHSIVIPENFNNFFNGADVYDSSCSKEAKVYFIDKGQGFFLKTSKKGSLEREALMTGYFNKKCLGAEVINYISDDSDWLLTTAVKGEDCTYQQYLDNPKRLCDTYANILRMLHETDFSDCPIKDRILEYTALGEQNYRTDNFDKSNFPDSFGYATAEDAYKVFCEGKHLLKNEVMIHGDYCLPNVMLDDWKFSGFIDVGNSGVGDRHIDLFWATWTLWFNLHTNDYYDRFLDAYGRDKVDNDKLKIVAAAEVFG